MATYDLPAAQWSGPSDWLNRIHHRAALNVFLVVVIAHWVEHIAQAVQIWGLGWSTPQARGALGLAFPWLVQSEALHYGYALVMLAGLWVLRRGFVGRARAWWLVAFGIQFWHHIEHLLLLVQVQSGNFILGGTAPTSVLQLLVPRVELHLFYNTVVFLPMVVAMYYHLRPSRIEIDRMDCSCLPPAQRLLTSA